jgi:hypothetical protein
MSAKHKVTISLVVSIVIVSSFIVFWKIANKPVTEQGKISNMPVQKAQKRSVTPATAIKHIAEDPTEGIPEISDKETEEMIAFLNKLEKSDNEEISTVTSDETLLSYEEELRQRLLRIKKTPEWKALQAEDRMLNTEGLDIPEELDQEIQAFFLNQYSVLGLGIQTQEEGNEMLIRGKISKEDIEHMKKAEQQYTKIVGEYRARQVAWMEATARIHKRRLELLGMTHRELCIAMGYPYIAGAGHDPDLPD